MVRFGGFPVWVGPTELVAAVRSVIGWTDHAVALVAGLPERVTELLTEVDALVRRIGQAVDEVERLVGTTDEVLIDTRLTVARAEQLLVDADALVRGTQPVLAEVGVVAAGAATALARVDGVAEGAAGVAERAGRLVDEAATTSGTASTLLALYAPMAERAAPLAGRFVEEFSEDELHAAIRMIDHLPQLTHHIETDVIPILTTLDRVGPDVHQLLEVLKEVRSAIEGVPGFRMLRRWGERDEAGR